MRPQRLELEGFGAFRDRTVVDFEGVDLFALTGPTGSGKTTLIDAMCFALYGNVPRYDDKRLVHPVISQGMPEARVRLDFLVGSVPYVAVRVLRRTKTGATTREARLERGGETLAGSEKELTAQVEQLLGLNYDHFTTCVVLPQGQFARFLHDKPQARQDVLVELLDLGLYGRIAALAGERARTAAQQAAFLDERLTRLAWATPEARSAADQRRLDLAALRDELGDAVGELARLAAAMGEAVAAAEAAATVAGALVRLAVPADVSGLATRVEEASSRLTGAEQAEDAAGVALASVEAELAWLPARRALESAADDHAEAARLDGLLVRGRQAVAAATAAEQASLTELASAAGRRDQAESALRAAEVAHRAHALRPALHAGEPCPVCLQPVTVLPAEAAPAGLDAAGTARAAAEEEWNRLGTAASAAEKERVRVEEKLANLDEQRTRLAARLDGRPPPDEVAAQLAALDQAEARLGTARQAQSRARDGVRAARLLLDEAREAGTEARRRFHEVHSGVAGWGAPSPSGLDLLADWQALVAWAAVERAGREGAAADARARADGLEAERAALQATVAARCAAHDLTVGRGGPLESVIAAHTATIGELARVDEGLAEAATVRAEAATCTARAQVAEALHRHLGARGFEKWLLDEALHQLVAGATATLLELSGGQYSLAYDDTGFAVVDHHSADQLRSARTLSGGETFLASLALALALADQLALFAGRSTARLEALFLDEGFGTLDPATLDVVASAIEELGAKGRMVGLVSHVAELAERVPVRYEVRKVGNAATVTQEMA